MTTKRLVALLLLLVPFVGQAQDRMPPIPAGALTEEQALAVAEFAAARGQVTGPWIALLRSPELMKRTRGLSDYLRFESPVPGWLREFVILITARQWGQNYEWNAHYAIAMDEGLSPDIARAIAEGRRPQGMAAEEQILYELVLELQRNHSVSDATYERAVERFGEQGVVEVVSLAGYYTMISMILNTSRAPLPDGATPALAPFPY
ncbi:MAG TPA: carboxymuconolactone decarboxylase family protein [Gammaproteobacteria bacterium]|nr:carboxymuconolactone decarboxylase family protein [Gammaproteobacteria bacterium]